MIELNYTEESIEDAIKQIMRFGSQINDVIFIGNLWPDNQVYSDEHGKPITYITWDYGNSKCAVTVDLSLPKDVIHVHTLVRDGYNVSLGRLLAEIALERKTEAV